MQKILKAQKMGRSVSVPLKEFGVELRKQYLVTKNGDEITIKKVIEEKQNANL